MALYLLINRCDIMYSYLLLLLLGYLCFCIAFALNPIESSDWDTRFSEISEKYAILDNCTQYNIKQESSCICFEYVDTCVVCCSKVPCCICEDAPCWYKQRQPIIIMTQIGISILFGFGIFGMILVYCKMCNRARQHARRCIMLHDLERELSRCSTIEGLRERPPSYNDVVRNAPPVYASSRNNAPPLYTSPYNRTSMQEAPPSYPGTPKPQEKSDSNELPPSPLIAQHM